MNACDEWPTPERWRIEHARRTWRAADEIILQSPSAAERRGDYEFAIDTALEHLRSLATFEELLNHYFRDRARPFEGGGPNPGTVEASVAAA